MDNKDTVLKEIIAGLHARDERVQERIYKRYWGYMMGVASRYFNDANSAREVVNDSFMKGFRTMYDFRHDGNPEVFEKSFRSWLAKITLRTALDKIKANKTPVVYVEEYEEVAMAVVPVDQGLLVQDILKLLYALPEQHRVVFNLYEIEGYSHEEIASTLLISVSSSRTFLTRAKHKLRQLYTSSLEIENGRP